MDFENVASAYPRVFISDPLLAEATAVLRWRASAFWGQQPAEQIQTRFRLNQDDWSEWSTLRELEVDGLAPGQYTFQVQASNLLGRTGDEISPITFSIRSPFHQRPEFLIPLGCLVIVIIGLTITLFDRRRHTVDLRLSEARFRSFFERAPISLWEHDYSDLKVY